MNFQNWLENICNTENPDERIIAYYFGLFETENGFCVYLTGSAIFDEASADWATNEDFIPKEKYFLLPGSKEQGWEEVLHKVQGLLSDFIQTDSCRNSFFNTAKAITTGFDDGDLIYIK